MLDLRLEPLQVKLLQVVQVEAAAIQLERLDLLILIGLEEDADIPSIINGKELTHAYPLEHVLLHHLKRNLMDVPSLTERNVVHCIQLVSYSATHPGVEFTTLDTYC